MQRYTNKGDKLSSVDQAITLNATARAAVGRRRRSTERIS